MDTDDLFRRTASFISALHEMEQRLSSSGQDRELTSLQQNLLRVLFFTSPKTLSGLSGCLNMNLPNTSREVKKLSEIGLVKKRQSDQDKRIIYLSLTEEGVRLVGSSLEMMKEKFLETSGEWTESRIKRTVDAIDALETELITKASPAHPEK